MKKKISVFVLIIILLFMSISNIKAITATPVYGHVMTGGIGRVTIYIDGTTSPTAAYWETLLVDAVNNWMYTGYGDNDFYGIYVSSNVGSKMDIYGRTSSYWGSDGPYVLASTSFYDNNNAQISPYYNDWFSAQIDLNDTVLRRDDISNYQATGTFIHEMGHAFGLAHNNSNVNSIMCPTGSGRAVQTVQQVDNDALNNLY